MSPVEVRATGARPRGGALRIARKRDGRRGGAGRGWRHYACESRRGEAVSLRRRGIARRELARLFAAGKRRALRLVREGTRGANWRRAPVVDSPKLHRG